MADPVEIVFRVSGIADVQQAFRSIDDIMSKFDSKRKSSGDRSVREARGQAAKQVDAHVREWDRWKKSVERIRSNSASMAGRLAGKQAGDEARAAAKRIAEEQRAARAIETIRTRSATMAGRVAKQQADREIAEAKRSVDKRLAMRKQVDESIGRAGASVGRSVSGVGRAAVNIGSAALALGGGMTIADTVGRLNSSEREAIAVSNDAYQEGAAGAAGRRRDPKALLSLAGRVQGETNIDKVKLLEGLHKYVEKSSDLEGGEKNLGEFARMAKASGTDLSEIMETAGKLRASNRHMAPEEMMSVMRGITGQGKEGTLTMRDLAAQGGKITSTAGQYTGSQTVNQRRLLGLAQVAGRENDAAESATAVTAFASDVAVHAKAIEKKGAKVLGADGKLLPGSDIIANIMAITGGNTAKLKELGIQREAVKVFHAAQGTFDDAGGGAAGAEAVRKDIKSLEDKGYSEKSLNEDFATVMAANGEKLEAAMLKLRDAIEKSVAPHLIRFAEKLPELVPKIEKVIDALGKLADVFINNPIKGVGAIIAGAVARDIALAGVGSSLKSIFTAIAVKATGGTPQAISGALGTSLTGGAATANSALGTGMAWGGGALAAAGIGAAVGFAITDATISIVNAKSRDTAVSSAGVMTGAGGPVTAANLAEKKAKAAALTGDIENQKKSTASEQAIGQDIFEGFAFITGQGKEFAAAQKAASDAQKASMAVSEVALKRLQASIAEAEAALAKPPANPNAAGRNLSIVDRNGGASKP